MHRGRAAQGPATGLEIELEFELEIGLVLEIGLEIDTAAGGGGSPKSLRVPARPGPETRPHGQAN